MVHVYLGKKKTPQQIPKDVHAMHATQLLITQTSHSFGYLQLFNEATKLKKNINAQHKM